jgi:DNA-binding NarL/FixJ family response regulator
MTVDRLGEDDIELLALLASGLSLDSVARRLDTSDRTVRRRIHQICERLGVRSTVEAVVWAVRRGLL